MKQLQIQAMLQIPADAVMNEFCWSYANGLLQKLKGLKLEGRICEKHSNGYYLTDIAHSVEEGLKKQMSCFFQTSEYDQNKEVLEAEADRLILLATEYLDAFRKPVPKKS